MSDFDELMAAPLRRKIGRPSNAERQARIDEAADRAGRKKIMNLATQGKTIVDERLFFNPVGVNFLHRVFAMDAQTIRTRLRSLPPLEDSHPSRPLWNFHEAVPYLIKPKMSLATFIKTLNHRDLPPEVNKAVWDAQRSRVKFKVESQEAWETEDVMQAFGEVAMLLKDSLTMVVEEMRSRAKLTDEQTEVFSEAIDELRAEIRRKLVEIPSKRATQSMHGKPLYGVDDGVDRSPDIGWYGDEGEADDQ